MKKYFYCYSNRMKKALIQNGFNYVCVGLNCKTHTKFWLFEATEELNYYKDHVYQTERDKY